MPKKLIEQLRLWWAPLVALVAYVPTVIAFLVAAWDGMSSAHHRVLVASATVLVLFGVLGFWGTIDAVRKLTVISVMQRLDRLAAPPQSRIDEWKNRALSYCGSTGTNSFTETTIFAELDTYLEPSQRERLTPIGVGRNGRLGLAQTQTILSVLAELEKRRAILESRRSQLV